MFCSFCGKVLDLQYTVECLGSLFCTPEGKKQHTAICLFSRFPEMDIASITSETIFLLMRPMFTVDKDVKKAVFDFMRKAFIVGNVSTITGQILDPYFDLTKGVFLEESLNYTLRLESAGTLFDPKPFQSMLLLHKFFLYVD
jgi:hypothetical protein